MAIQNTQDPALAGAAQMEQLADRLSQAADVLHAQIVRAIRLRSPENGGGITQTEAQNLFEHEVSLRQQTMALHLDAARHAIAGLEISQASVLELVNTAAQKIARIDNIKELIDIGVSLLNLAGAVVAGKPEKVISTLRKVRSQVQVRQTKPELPAPGQA